VHGYLRLLRASSTRHARLELENRFGFRCSPPPSSPEGGLDEDCAPPKKNAQPAPFPQERGEISNAIDVEDPTLLASFTRCDPRAVRQDASPPNQQTTETSRHPSDFVEIAVGLRSRTLRPVFAHLRVDRAVDTATFQPAFPTIHGEHEGHDARSSSRAVSRSSICSVVRSGPATGIRARKPRLLPHAREKLCDPRFQAKISSPSRLPLSRSQLAVSPTQRSR